MFVKEGEILINARYDEEFVFNDGTRAKNILELMLKLEHLDAYEFQKFVNSTKNDFANWIAIVLNDARFADKLRKVMTREETIRLIEIKLNESSSEIIKAYPKPNVERTEKVQVTNTVSNIDNTSSNINTSTSTVAASNAIHLLSSSAIHVSNDKTSVDKKPFVSETLNQNDKTNVSKEIKSSRNWFKFSLKKYSFGKKLDSIQSDTDSSAVKSKNEKTSNILNNTKNTNTNITNVNASDNSNRTSEGGLSSNSLHHKNIFKRKLWHKPHHDIRLDYSNSHKEDAEESESALWMVLYIVLIVLIVSLLVYKLFLS